MTKAAIIGIKESKLDHTVPESEIRSKLSRILYLRCDRNRNSGGVACYIRKDLCFNTGTLHCKEIENLVFGILLPKSKPVAIGVFWKNFVEKFSNLNLKDSEIYLFGDFNINLFQNGKYMLYGKRSTTSQRSVHTMINRYKEICQINSFKTINNISYTCNMQQLHYY